MTIVNVGISYRTAPAATLEKLAVLPGDQQAALGHLRALSGVDEVFLLSTCNRVEVYAAAVGPAEEVARCVTALLADRAELPADVVQRLAGVRIDGAAAEHLFAVVCGLDSMAVGEEQIVAQVKAAARNAAAAGTTGSILTGLLDSALRASKRARTETTIGTSGVSLVRAGLDAAREHLGDLAGRDAVVVGTGSVGKLAVRLLHEAGARLSIVSRSPARAAELAATVWGRAVPADGLGAAIAEADLLVTAMGSPAPIVRAGDVNTTGLFVLDLGLPPDVEPAVGRLPGVRHFNLAALGRQLADADVPDQVPQVRAIVSAEVAFYLARREQAAAGPVITALHAHLRELADAELARLHE
ncbi:MAG TPA: glutamyl-tRNA reductase, partial [Jatrophihabitans sp.]|nr:glutamyl-tRNA reductase [Jatrophihabitans sp.]